MSRFIGPHRSLETIRAELNAARLALDTGARERYRVLRDELGEALDNGIAWMINDLGPGREGRIVKGRRIAASMVQEWLEARK